MPRPRKIRPTLTKRAIDATKPTRHDTFLWDGADHGLGVKVTPTGAKILIFQKTIRGRLRRITLGKWGDTRVCARQLNGEIARGRDPVADERTRREEEERRERSEKTVGDLWDRYWLEIVLPANRSRTASEKRYMWKSRIEPSVGTIKLKDVTDEDAGAIVRGAMRRDKDGNITFGRGAAGNLYRLLHHMFAKALAWRMRPRELGNLGETKTGFSPRPVSAEAMGAITEVERRPGCPFVFRSPKDPTRPVEYTLVRKTFDCIANQTGVGSQS